MAYALKNICVVHVNWLGESVVAKAMFFAPHIETFINTGESSSKEAAADN